MIQRLSAFSALFLTAALAVPVAAAAQAPAAPAAPAAQAPAPQRGRGPAGPPAPCGPSVTGKNIAAGSRCFELRTYTVRAEGPGDINLIHARFRDHTDRLLRKHGMDILGYWQPTNAGMENTLMYLVAYKDRAARDAAWKAFQSDPEWVKVRTDMNVGLQVESIFMNAADYSAMK
jgi:hypothetical protein